MTQGSKVASLIAAGIMLFAGFNKSAAGRCRQRLRCSGQRAHRVRQDDRTEPGNKRVGPVFHRARRFAFATGLLEYVFQNAL